jgi:hypothetical protein
VNPHYSDLWAAALEATQTENGTAPAAEASVEYSDAVAVEVSNNGHEEHSPEPYEQDGRDALRALLAEVTSTADPSPAAVTDEPVDGLRDRGPWTSNELASFEQDGGWAADESEQAPAAPAEAAYDAPSHPSEQAPDYHGALEADAEAEEPVEEQAAEEPINRGLLLKFLSSVRN